jgi:hypothetical protein
LSTRCGIGTGASALTWVPFVPIFRSPTRDLPNLEPDGTLIAVASLQQQRRP